ncbi:uncharacterized protein MYCGRDRAFT_90682 [Zymoseptoria tritici IPO323]|uniref:Integrase zinc-binding domain-containing protein n=1 Tax=Zymoseptoria tritici (strain CBS 115943 / IPO323) TaxID=336722 RepID=F9X281_ZYMTI|nr:uncharacterized protein MYCGRDRAFT_90682 [Zymoseptoria tritici IPO323]EGP90575.1 hypothetical protein MYCGRDRAFT_90682 [Zymoseptoria tritici IPO323]
MLSVLETVAAEADIAITQAANEPPPLVHGPYTREGKPPILILPHTTSRKSDTVSTRQLWRMLDDGTDPAVDSGLREGLRFFTEDGLIYYVDPVNRAPRLCIPPSLQHEIFEAVHDHRHHAGIERCLDRIGATFYIRHCKKNLQDWSVMRALISDRNPKWLSDFFTGLLKALGARLLALTAYHPQTDGQTWTDVLPSLTSYIGSSKNASTGVLPDQMLFGFNLNTDAFIGLRELPPADYTKLRQQYRDAADEALAFAAVDMKYRYDKTHKRISFDAGDYVYLRLHHSYRI